MDVMRNVSIWALLAIVACGLLGSCAKETTPSKEEEKDELTVEGVLQGSWTIPYENLTDDQKGSYKQIDLRVEANDDFVWTLYAKNGSTYTMTGGIMEEKSNYQHSSGAGIWNIRFFITHINGQELSGGYYGVYSFDDENSLLMNVEPDVRNWSEHPTAEGGIGSGLKGDQSVYHYSKVIN